MKHCGYCTSDGLSRRKTEAGCHFSASGQALEKAIDGRSVATLATPTHTIFILDSRNPAETLSAPRNFVSFLFSHITLHTGMAAILSFAL